MPTETYELVRKAVVELTTEDEHGITVHWLMKRVALSLPDDLFDRSSEMRTCVQRVVFDLKAQGILEQLTDLDSVEISPAVKGREAFLDAIRRGHTKVAKRLLATGVDLSLKNAGLVSAVINNRVEIVRLLIDAEADVNSRDSLFERTPLMYVTPRTSKDIVRLLKGAGAVG